jgi:hypothetical protein
VKALVTLPLVSPLHEAVADGDGQVRLVSSKNITVEVEVDAAEIARIYGPRVATKRKGRPIVLVNGLVKVSVVKEGK